MGAGTKVLLPDDRLGLKESLSDGLLGLDGDDELDELLDLAGLDVLLELEDDDDLLLELEGFERLKDPPLLLHALLLS